MRFFNDFSKYCDLTVLYERERSANRDSDWVNSEEGLYKTEFLGGITLGNESKFSWKILKYVFGDYDLIILGCYNTPVQMLASLAMRLFRKKFIINLDGEMIGEESGFKTKLKIFFMRGAESYLIAGEKAGENLQKYIRDKKIIPYYFSSLNEKEIKTNCALSKQAERNNTVLVLGQYFDYKGLDIALKVACMDNEIQYVFAGMGNRTELFKKEVEKSGAKNVHVIPFLNKEELNKAYLECGMLVLPTRKECWGLVVNEAASYGTPIVSTWGSGAAVEYLADRYPQYLAEAGNAEDIYIKILELRNSVNIGAYQNYLIEKSRQYTIEHMVEVHCRKLL